MPVSRRGVGFLRAETPRAQRAARCTSSLLTRLLIPQSVYLKDSFPAFAFCGAGEETLCLRRWQSEWAVSPPTGRSLSLSGKSWCTGRGQPPILPSGHFLQQTPSPFILQGQECVPASGELSPEGQEWFPYSPGHASRHGNPLLHPNRPSVGKLLGPELGAGLFWAHGEAQSLRRGDIVTHIQPVIVVVGPVSVGYVLGSL